MASKVSPSPQSLTRNYVDSSEGSGKSHTLSVLLENMFVSGCSQIGVLNRPLSGLVLHYGEVGSSAHPSEAAHLAMAANSGPTTPAVHVFVSKSSLATMKALYARLGSHIVVEPLYLTESELDAQAFLSMMAVGTTDAAPLYMQIVLVRYESFELPGLKFPISPFCVISESHTRIASSLRGWSHRRQCSTQHKKLD